MATVSAHVAVTLSYYVDHVFGVMGNGNAYFLDALERDTDGTFTAVRHEVGGVVAADVFYRAGGGLGAATATFGPGFTNTLTALAEAARVRSAIVLIVGDMPTSGPRPWDVDQVALASAVGVRTFTVNKADAASITVAAVEYANAHRAPVVIAIPYDLSAVDAGAIPALSATPTPLLVGATDSTTPAAIEDVVQALAAAERPFLLAGRGAWLAHAGDALGRLADATGAVTGSSALARGIFPRSKFDLGVTGGFGAEGAMQLIQDADVAVVFGASLNQFTTRFGELFASHTRVIQVDLEDQATNARVDTYIRADAAVAANALVAELDSRNAESSHWREAIDFGGLLQRDGGEEFAPDGRLDPRPVAIRIGELLPADRVVVSDGGHFIGWANMYWPVQAPDRMVMCGTGFQSIGLGLPSVPGAAMAKPDSAIILSTGDGGGLMALADLESAIRVAQGRGLALVWNDSAYSAEVTLYGRVKGLAEAPMLIPEVDFAGIARALDAEAVVVRTLADVDRLAEWVAEPVAERKYLLLDLRVSNQIVAPYQQEIIRVNS